MDITTQSPSSGNNKNNNVEVAAVAQVQMLEIDSKNEDSIQPLSKHLKLTALYDHHKITPIPSDSI